MSIETEKLVQSEPRIVVVAGCSSGAGKTSVAEAVTGLLARLCRTAAAKITVTHGDRGCPHGGKGCNICSSLADDFQIIVTDSIISQPGTDTARLRVAGGHPVVWAITRDIALESAWQGVRARIKDVDCIVVESNSLAAHIDPTLTLMVVDASISRKIWKPSALHLISTADYVVFNMRGAREKREALLEEIESLRDGLGDVIYVNHPHDVTADRGLITNLESKCLDLARR